MWHHAHRWAPYSLWQSWKRNCCRGFRLFQHYPAKSGESQEQRAVVQHVDSRQGENRKKASCCTLLKRINYQFKKCKFRDHVGDSLSYLERYSPKGSCHRDQSSMNHTLAHNNLCEFWCGMHLTCNNNPITPDRNGLVIGPEKVRKVPIALAHARCKIFEADFNSNHSHLDSCENCTGFEVTSSGSPKVWVCIEKTVWKIDMPVLGLAGGHRWEWENDAGTQSWSGSVSPRTDSVFVGQWLSVVHFPPAIKDNWNGFEETKRPWGLKKWKMKNRCAMTATGRSFTSIQMFHTQTTNAF